MSIEAGKRMTSNLRIQVERMLPDVLLVRLSANDDQPAGESSGIAAVCDELDHFRAAKALSFQVTGSLAWDSRLVAFIRNCNDVCRERHLEFRDAGLPEGVRRLLRLAQAVPERKDTDRSEENTTFLQRVGVQVIKERAGGLELFTFLGENLIALWKLLRGRAQFRWADAWLVVEQCGPKALGIVAMINFLMGLILAFVGAIQLQRFGASIYVADLVGIASVREMGCVMTGIILCGRTGAAFAAQLGTMKVNEEINALQTFGISPVEFLVLPRMIALMLVMPFLCVLSDFISIAGGFVVSVSMLDVTPIVYLTRTFHSIPLDSFLLGICKGCFFGVLVAYTGCLRGMQSGASAAAVGEATTKAVVTGISAIIASDGIFAVLAHVFGI